MANKKKIVVLTGAGMSAESGLKTFRDSNGLWEGHDVMEVASPQGFARNPELVLEFYNQRRRQLLEVSPNEGHLALVDLESRFDVSIVTQNVDNLHEQAGSSHVVHLHGELFKVRSMVDENVVVGMEKGFDPRRFGCSWASTTPAYCLVWRNGAHDGSGGQYYAASGYFNYHRNFHAGVSGGGFDQLCPNLIAYLFYRPQTKPTIIRFSKLDRDIGNSSGRCSYSCKTAA